MPPPYVNLEIWRSACHMIYVCMYDICRLACKIYTTNLTANNILQLSRDVASCPSVHMSVIQWLLLPIVLVARFLQMYKCIIFRKLKEAINWQKLKRKETHLAKLLEERQLQKMKLWTKLLNTKIRTN